MNFVFEAFVTDIVTDGAKAAFALGDGTLAWEDGARVEAHDGSILCAAAHPSGDGVITGGDDGRLVWCVGGDARTLASAPRKWIDALAVSRTSGLIAYSTGREARVLDAKAADFERVFPHEASVAALAFDPFDHLVDGGPLPRVKHLLKQCAPVGEVPVEAAPGDAERLGERLDPDRVRAAGGQRAQALFDPRAARYAGGGGHRLSLPPLEPAFIHTVLYG